jgi:hypothetical protein
MHVESLLYRSLTGIGIPADQAERVAEALSKSIDERYEWHHKQLATRRDLEAVKSDISRLIIDTQRWTIAAVFGGLAAFSLIQKLL